MEHIRDEFKLNDNFETCVTLHVHYYTKGDISGKFFGYLTFDINNGARYSLEIGDNFTFNDLLKGLSFIIQRVAEFNNSIGGFILISNVRVQATPHRIVIYETLSDHRVTSQSLI